MSNQCSVPIMEKLNEVNQTTSQMPMPRNRDQVEEAQAILEELRPLVESYSMLQNTGDDTYIGPVVGYLLAHVKLAATEHDSFHILDLVDAFAAEMDNAAELKEFASNIRADDKAVRRDYQKGRLADEIVEAYNARSRGGRRLRFE